MTAHLLRKSLLRTALTALGVTLLSAGAAHADLIGSTVTASLYYPDLATLYAGPQSATVSGAVEFPSIAFDGTLDVTGNQIIWTATSEQQYGSGAFNGFQLVFSGAPAIIGASNDGATTLAYSWNFTPDTVYLNLQGDHAFNGQQAILDLSFAPVAAVPEPLTLSIFGAGLAGVAALRRRKRAKA